MIDWRICVWMQGKLEKLNVCLNVRAGAAGYSAYQTVEVGDISKGVWTVLTKTSNPNQAEVGTRASLRLFCVTPIHVRARK